MRGDGFCSVWSVLVGMVFEGYMTPEQAMNEITNFQMSVDERTPIHAYILWLLKDWKLEDGTLRNWRTPDNRDGIPWDPEFVEAINRSSEWVNTLHTSNLFRLLAQRFNISVEVGLYTNKVLTRVVYGEGNRITVVSTGPHYNVWSRKVNPEKLGKVKKFYQRYLYHANLASISNIENEREKTQDIIARLDRLMQGAKPAQTYTKEEWMGLIQETSFQLRMLCEALGIKILEEGGTQKPDPEDRGWIKLKEIFEAAAEAATRKEVPKMVDGFNMRVYPAPLSAYKIIRQTADREKWKENLVPKLEENRKKIIAEILKAWFPKN